jgi:hypothetical protein
MIGDIANWISTQPVMGLLMLAAALVAFSSALSHSKVPSDAIWPWLRRIIEASVKAMLLLGLLWAFYATLSHDIEAFSSTHNSVLAAQRSGVEASWGKPITQDELVVNHFIQVAKLEEIPQKDPAKPKLYRNVKERQPVPQNSVIGFRGDVSAALDERELLETKLAVYTVSVCFEYDVVNNSDFETEAEFRFPFAPDQTFENFGVTVDGQAISSQLRFASDGVAWKGVMRPQQQNKVTITYVSKGRHGFSYRVPVQREIKNLALTVTADSKAFRPVVEPGGDLMSADSKDTDDHRGATLTWKLDRVIMAPLMGIIFYEPEKPDLYGKVQQMLQIGPKALTLLVAMLALTLLIGGQPARFLDLALAAGAYCVQFLIMGGVSDYVGFWGLLVGAAVLSGVLTFFVFRWLTSKLLRVLVYALAGFFIFVYPRSAFFIETQRNTFDGIVQVGLIVYLFGLTLYTQLEARRARALSV